MVRTSDPYRLYHTIKPGRGKKFEFHSRSMMRTEWADFCTEHCPHPGKCCEKRPCREFRARFGKVDGL